MFKSAWDGVVLYFRTGGIAAKLLLINIAVFLAVNLLGAFMNISAGASFNPDIDSFLNFFSLSSDLKYFLFHPWGILTHMFLHHSLHHIFWNMILLYVFGSIVTDLLGNRRVLAIYIMGGLFGGFLYLLSGMVLPDAYTGKFALGASGAVMALIFAAGSKAPDYRISFIFFTTKLKYFIFFLLFMDLVGLSAMASSNTGHLSHLGGAFFGWLFVNLLNKGTDLSIPFNRFTDRIVGIFESRPQPKRPQPKVAFKNKEKINQKRQQPGRRSDYGSVQERIDAILDKINRKGMKSLSPEEKAFLNDYNKL